MLYTADYCIYTQKWGELIYFYIKNVVFMRVVEFCNELNYFSYRGSGPMSTEKCIIFRRLEEKDLELMYRWLNTDFVVKWYEKGGCSFDKVVKKYLPRIKGEQSTFSYVIVCDNKDIGYIQTYMIEDYPEYNQYVNSDEHAAGMDMFIGERDYIHKGLGKHILTKFLREFVFHLNYAQCCIIGPELKNMIAIRAYQKSGFRYFKTIQVPDEDEPQYLMKIYKNEIEQNKLIIN